MCGYRGLVLVVLVALGGTACASTTQERPRAVTVSAASSLQQAFDRMALQFERAEPGAQVSVNYGPSSTLVRQILAGAPADLLATADAATMGQVRDQQQGPARIFARNRMVIVTKPGNPRGIRTVADLPRASVVALCAPAVPCGSYAAQVLARAGVQLAEDRVTRAADATSTLGAVRNGDADAAIVYRTDAQGGGVAVVSIPDEENVIADYPIATMEGSESPATARAFVRFVRSPAGRRVLAASGFLAP